MTTSRKLIHGWKKDSPDERDHVYLKVINESELPKSVDLQVHCPPVYDQGQLGSCTANSLAAAVEFDQIKQKKTNVYVPSRLFIYYNERAIENDVNQDNGAQIRDGIKALATEGVCSEAEWPYNVDMFTTKPSDNCYTDAKTELITTYERLDNTNIGMLKACLAEGYPFVFGFTVYSYFESEEMATTGVLKMPAAGEQEQGGHAVLCVGYDDTKKMFKVRNSWGAQWGDAGYFWMPYEYMTNPGLANDFWKITFVE